MFTQKGKIGLLVSCLVAALSIASCGGGAGSPLDAVEATDGSNQVIAATDSPDVLNSDQMPSLREASAPNPGDYLEIDPVPDWWDSYFLAIHDSLASGDNVIDVTTPTYKNSNASVESVIAGFHINGMGDIVPEYQDALVLSSNPGEMAYATFGFSDIPDGEEMLTITAHGYGNYGSHPNNGLYIGIGDMEDGVYEWFGPYAPDASEYKVSTWGLDTANSSGRGYVTFAVYNGDEFVLMDLEVEVGERQFFPGFDWDLIEIPSLIPPGGYFEMPWLSPQDLLDDLPIPLPDPPMPEI